MTTDFIPDFDFSEAFDRLYGDYEKALIVPAIMVIFAIAVLGLSYANTGDVLQKGIDFTGGTAIQVQVPNNVELDQVRQAFDGAGTSVRTMSGAGEGNKWIIIETQETFPQDTPGQAQDIIRQRLNQANIPFTGEISVQTLGSSVGAAFFNQAVFWSGVALLIMSIVIFVAFRTVVPSLAVIFAALTDILFAMAGMNLLGIELTLGSLAALLMLLGYSVDTDILLSTRVLKQRKGDLKERIRKSIVTGSTMTLAAIAAFTVLFVVSPSTVLDQIAGVIIIGLVADLPVTWLGNAVILKMYVER